MKDQHMEGMEVIEGQDVPYILSDHSYFGKATNTSGIQNPQTIRITKLQAYQPSQRQTQNTYLANLGLHRIPIIGDGNCLFRSVSFSVYGNQDQHLRLRSKSVNYILKHREQFEMFFDDFEKEVDELQSEGSYAGQESILALSYMLDINIQVTMGGNETALTTIEHNPNNVQDTIHLLFSNAHYDSVSNKEGILNTVKEESTNNREQYKGSINIKEYTVDNKSIKRVDLGNKTEPIQAKSKPQKTYLCPECKIEFKRKDNLKVHIDKRRCKSSQQSFPCPVGGCSCRFVKVSTLVDHMVEVHNSDLEISEHTFADENEFKSWKSSVELKYNVQYNKRRKSKTSSKGYTDQFVCFRSGYVRKIKSTSKKPRNSKGHVQMNKICLSRIYLRKEQGIITCKFIETHNHDIEMGNAKFMHPGTSHESVNDSAIDEFMHPSTPHESVNINDSGIDDVESNSIQDEEQEVSTRKKLQQETLNLLEILKKQIKDPRLQPRLEIINRMLRTIIADNEAAIKLNNLNTSEPKYAKQE